MWYSKYRSVGVFSFIMSAVHSFTCNKQYPSLEQVYSTIFLKISLTHSSSEESALSSKADAYRKHASQGANLLHVRNSLRHIYRHIAVQMCAHKTLSIPGKKAMSGISRRCSRTQPCYLPTCARACANNLSHTPRAVVIVLSPVDVVHVLQ
jgi:hypothetical protein